MKALHYESLKFCVITSKSNKINMKGLVRNIILTVYAMRAQPGQNRRT